MASPAARSRLRSAPHRHLSHNCSSLWHQEHQRAGFAGDLCPAEPDDRRAALCCRLFVCCQQKRGRHVNRDQQQSGSGHFVEDSNGTGLRHPDLCGQRKRRELQLLHPGPHCGYLEPDVQRARHYNLHGDHYGVAIRHRLQQHSTCGISINAFAAARTIGLQIATLNAQTGAIVNYCGTGFCTPNPGATFSINVTSSNTTVGTIVTSAVTFAPGASTATTSFLPNDLGQTNIALGTQPSGMSAGAGILNAAVTTVTGDVILAPDAILGAGSRCRRQSASIPPRAARLV